MDNTCDPVLHDISHNIENPSVGLFIFIVIPIN